MNAEQKPQRQRKEANRTRIMEAALELAREEGWANITMRRIADRVQYTHPALYGYFATKQDLLTALLRQGLQMLQHELETARASTDDPHEALRALAEAYWRFAFEQPELYQVMHGLGGVAFTNADVQAEERQIGSPVARAIERVLEQHGKPTDDIDQRVTLLWSTIHGLVTLTMAGRFEQTYGVTLFEQMIRDSLAAWGIENDEPTN